MDDPKKELNKRKRELLYRYFPHLAIGLPDIDMLYRDIVRRVDKFTERTAVQGPVPERMAPPLQIYVGVVSRWTVGDRFTRTGRPDLSLSLITRGSAEYLQDGRRGSVACGQIFLAHKGAAQSLHTGDAGFMHKRTVILTGVALDALVASMRLNEVDVVTPRNPSSIMRWFREAYRCMTAKPPDMAGTLSVLAWRILLECQEGLSLIYPPGLRRAMDYVAANIQRPLTVGVLASEAGVSPRQCARLFQAHLGCSPMAFCATQRMTVARAMVQHTSHPMKQVANAVGFEDQLYFSARFRRHFGMSPSECRRRAQV